MLGYPFPEGGVIYGSTLLFSQREQPTKIYVGSYRALQVWLNGTLIHEHERYERIWNDYTDFYPVTLQQGKNVLLIALSADSHDMGFLGFEEGTEYILGGGFTFSATETTLLASDTFTLNLNAEKVT